MKIMKKHILTILFLLILVSLGCGSQSGNNPFPITQSSPSTKIALKGSINTKLSSTGRVYFLGELKNEGQHPACFVKISIDSKDGAGKLIDTDFTYIDGSTMLVLGTNIDTCLYPDELASFELISSLTSIPASFSYKINWDTEQISYPEVSQAQVVMDGIPTETINSSGNKKILGYIKNLNSTRTIGFVKINITALKDGKVIDNEFTYINGSSCMVSGITIDSCLAPGESGSFEAWLNVPPSEVTDYYYKINYDVVK